MRYAERSAPPAAPSEAGSGELATVRHTRWFRASSAEDCGVTDLDQTACAGRPERAFFCHSNWRRTCM